MATLLTRKKDNHLITLAYKKDAIKIYSRIGKQLCYIMVSIIVEENQMSLNYNKRIQFTASCYLCENESTCKIVKND